MNEKKWVKRMLDIADVISTWSKDTTQTSAIITDDKFCVLSTGFNGFPRNVKDDIPERFERPTKYYFTEHSERNAIYTAARRGIKLNGTYMFLKWHPCSACARAIIQSGISKLYCSKPDFSVPHWGVDFIAADAMLEESDVEVIYLEDLNIDGLKYER